MLSSVMCWCLFWLMRRYNCVSQTIQLNISHVFTCRFCIVLFQTIQFSLYTQLSDQTVLFTTDQFSISHLFALSLNVKQLYLTHRWDPIRCYHSGPEWIWEWWQWRGTLHSPKLKHYWILTIKLFRVISRTVIRGVSLLCRDAVVISYSPSRLSS